MEETVVSEIRKRLVNCPLPFFAMADYEGTNHYEIQDLSPDAREFWWLDYLDEAVKAGSGTEEGKRLGAVLDYACHYRRDVGALLAEIDRLQKVPRVEKCASRRPTRS